MVVCPQENLELLALSVIPYTGSNQRTRSPPLKVVYRDMIVGIRYLHPRDVPLGFDPVRSYLKDAQD